MNYLLSEAEEPIRQALERLCAKDIALRPFLIVWKVGNKDVFVQFARYVKDGQLAFDVPPLGIYLDPTGPEEGARRAVDTLLGFGVLPDERVVLEEEEDAQPPGRGESIWSRLFRRKADA